MPVALSDVLLFEKANVYVQASNDHDLAAIKIMFVPQAGYLSSGVGQRQGAAAVLSMMRASSKPVPTFTGKRQTCTCKKQRCRI